MINKNDANQKYRLSADIGGTFTDVASFNEDTGELHFGKALSTPSALVGGINQAVEIAELRYEEAGLFLHGATVAINTMLERNGAKTALITTDGFRDIYEIGRINRPDAYNLFFQKHIPLIPRSLRFEVTERMYAEGEICTPLDESQIEEISAKLKHLNIESVAILFLHAYRNPIHEIKAREILKQKNKNLFISVSHELSQEYREFERTSTVAANAYIGPKVRNYISGIEQHIENQGFSGSFLIVQSTGGLFNAEHAKSECIRMLESGPAAGVIGTKVLCDAMNIKDAISFDMGGTTAKSGVVLNGTPMTTGSALVGGYDRALPIQVPMIDIFEVGTGGGSVAGLGTGNDLHVGPLSAGADPGPACYGLGGTEPTVTDANLVLGRLAADRFLGGEMQLDAQKATHAIERKICEPLGLGLVEAAEGILRIAATDMSHAVKAVSTERGLDAASFPMVAFGGAGPLHASQVAREIGMKKIIVPSAPGYFSAFGMMFSDLRYDYVKTAPARLADFPWEQFERFYGEMEAKGRAAIESAAVSVEKIEISRAADMRYLGQEHAVTVDLEMACFENQNRNAIKTEFDRMHEQRYGTSAPNERAEIVSLRCSIKGVMKKPKLAVRDLGTLHPPEASKTGYRKVCFFANDGFVETPSYNRAELQPGNEIIGPAVIDEHASTTVVFPHDSASVDSLGSLLINISN